MWMTPLESYPPESESNSESVAASSAAALFFVPSKSMPAYSHHRQDTLNPGRQVDRSKRSRIGRVAMYCATMFCLLVTDFMIPYNPDYPSASSNGG